ncbi:MAG: histidinol-phosphate transaminase [Chloroflexi bacterium]|nr:histidinol-phosphate transaminase [Chloroflexota bacterium]
MAEGFLPAGAPTVHGGLDEEELRVHGLTRRDVLDFSSNVNPLGTSRLVRKAAAKADLSAYPDRRSLVLSEALSSRLDVCLDEVLIGNGSTELIHLLARACLGPRRRCLILGPTFGEYEAAATLAGAEVHFVEATRPRGFVWSADAVIRAIETLRPALTFLCNPNNPTGVYVDRDFVMRLTRAIGGRGLLVLDTSYVPFAEAPWDERELLACGNVVLLRSMTKDHALAGARLGYLVAGAPTVSALRRLQPSWSVSAVAQAAGLAALDDNAHLEVARAVVAEAKAYLRAQLDTLGLQVVDSAANFMLVRVGDAAALRRELLCRGIAVRDCTSFGLPAYIRVAVRRLDECQRLTAAMREVLAHG